MTTNSEGQKMITTPKRELEVALNAHTRAEKGPNWVVTDYVTLAVVKNLDNTDEFDYLMEHSALPHSLLGLGARVMVEADRLAEEDEEDDRLAG